jgi:hypothetical protein
VGQAARLRRVSRPGLRGARFSVQRRTSVRRLLSQTSVSTDLAAKCIDFYRLASQTSWRKVPNMPEALKDYTQRPNRYQNIDGTLEMGIGLFYLIFVVLACIQSVLPNGFIRMHRGMDLISFCLTYLSLMGLSAWGGKMIKKHVTYPRTGYVAYRRPTRTRSAVYFGMGAVVAAVVAATLVRFAAKRPDVMPLVGSMVNVVIYAAVVSRLSREHPWKRFVVLFMALGLFTTAYVSPRVFDRWSSLFVSLTWLISGGVTLYLYIRHTQPPAPEVE